MQEVLFPEMEHRSENQAEGCCFSVFLCCDKTLIKKQLRKERTHFTLLQVKA